MASVSFSIKPFRPGVDDPADIARVHLEIRQWQEKINQNKFLDILDSQADLRALDEYYVGRGGNFFVAKDSGNRIIGFMGLRNDGGGRGVMKRLAVIPECQRQGVGRALVAAAIDWASGNGFTKLSLHTGITEKARPLYEKFGFRVLGVRQARRDQYMELDLLRTDNG